MTKEIEHPDFNWLCAAQLSTAEDALMLVAEHTLYKQEYLKVRRMNNLLGHEIGLASACFPELDYPSLFRVLIEETAKRILTRTPQETVQETIGLTYKSFTEFNHPHYHLGRGQIDASYPPMEANVAVAGFMVVNVLGRLPEDLSTWLLCLTEAINNLMYYESVSFDEIKRLCGIKHLPKTDNVVVMKEWPTQAQ